MAKAKGDSMDFSGLELECEELTSTGTVNAADLEINSVAVTSTAAELNILDGVTATAAEINAACDGSSAYVVVTDAATYSVLAANSKKTHIIPDLTADCVLSLPTAADGLSYKFIYGGAAVDAQDWQFDTGDDTNFYLGGLVQHDPDNAGDDTLVYYPDGDSNSIVNVLTPNAGTVVELYCDGTNWYLHGTVISATDTAVTYADQA